KAGTVGPAAADHSPLTNLRRHALSPDICYLLSHHTRERLMRMLLVGLLIVTAVGCQRGVRMADDALLPLAQLRFPGEAPLGDDLDIVVVRHGSTIELANRTPNSYRDVQLWLNEQWVTVIEQIAIGTGNPPPLDTFGDRHGRTFPTAGLLTPEKTRPLVHAV